MNDFTFQRIEDRPVNVVQVLVHTESGCSVKEGEYTTLLGGFLGALSLDVPGGMDDPTLILDCIKEHIDEYVLPEEGCSEFILIESGEWQDVFWHKYYEIARATQMYPDNGKLKKKTEDVK